MKRNTLHLLLLLVFIASCNSNRKKTAVKSKPISNEVVPMSTAYEYPKFEAPAEFYFNAILIKDTVVHADYNCTFLQSVYPEMQPFNQAIETIIKNKVAKDRSYVSIYKDASQQPAYSFDLHPLFFYSNEKIISIMHMIDTYTDGGNHHNYEWFSFNYDLENNRMISFKDVIHLKSKKDSIDFVALLNEVDTSCCGDWGLPLIIQDFSFSKTGILINTAASSEGSIQITIPYDSCSKYGKDFGKLKNRYK